MVDYYKVMGISKDTPQDEIKSAYRKRSKQFHPDLHPNDPKAKAKFQMLNEAYDVLNDPEKRKLYDQYGENWKNAGAFGGGGQSYGGGQGFGGFSGFGGQGGFSGFGGGSSGGMDFGSIFENLFGGRRSRSGFGGEEHSHGSSDVHSSITIDMYQAIFGCEVLITTTNGSKLKMKIQPGTQPGKQMRLKGKGNVGMNGVAGDLILTINVTLPELNDRQKEKLNEIRNMK